MSKKWVVTSVVLGIALGLVFLLAYTLSAGRVVAQTIDFAVENLVNVSGMSSNLARGLLILTTIPLFWAVAKYSKGFLGYEGVRPSLRLYTNIHGLIIVGYVGSFFLLMHFASRNSFFGHSTGEILKWCAETPEGIAILDSPGKEPVYGIDLYPCTHDQIIRYRQQTVGIRGPQRVQVSDPRTYEFFDAISGSPRVWYYPLPDGTYDVFDRPGKHPGTGEDLRPITGEIVRTLVATAKRRRPATPMRESTSSQGQGSQVSRRPSPSTAPTEQPQAVTLAPEPAVGETADTLPAAFVPITNEMEYVDFYSREVGIGYYHRIEDMPLGAFIQVFSEENLLAGRTKDALKRYLASGHMSDEVKLLLSPHVGEGNQAGLERYTRFATKLASLKPNARDRQMSLRYFLTKNFPR